MRLEYQILIAIALDLAFGDPRWFPHPVKLMGRFAMWFEGPMRSAIRNPKLAGVVTAVLVVGVSTAGALGLVLALDRLSPVAGTVVSILLIYTSIAARDLMKHSREVYLGLAKGDIDRARSRVSWMVGRDTDCLDEAGVVRAAVESVAENTVDGVTAPLFFAVIGGPVGAIAYKAISTLDSTFGYKNERYIDFGWASAKLDDVANFVPARLTAPLVALAAAILGMRPANALRVCLRDRRKHASTNSGIAEAGMAGALGVQLGGLLHRKGKPVEMPLLGDMLTPLERATIPRVNALMLATMLLSAAAFLGLRLAGLRLLEMQL